MSLNASPWIATDDAYLRSDHGEAVRDACVNGMRIAKCATWIAYKHLKKGKLVQILEDTLLLDDAAILAVYPSSRLLAPKVRAFIDYFLSITAVHLIGMKKFKPCRYYRGADLFQFLRSHRYLYENSKY